MTEAPPCLNRAVFDLLKKCEDRRMDAGALLYTLREMGYAATVESVFAIPFVDTCFVGDLVESNGFCLMPGTRKPCE